MTARAYSITFAVYALVAAAIVAAKVPPFMAPDESNHIRRANSIALGAWVDSRFEQGGVPTAGGPCEPSLADAERVFEPIAFHPDRKVDPAETGAAAKIMWGSQTSQTSFENTAIYPPTFYLPAAEAIDLGKATGQSVLDTVSMARAANAVVCIALSCVAIAIAGSAAPYLFALLLFPMSVFLASTVSQDGMLIACSALACSLIARALTQGRPLAKRELWVAALCLAFIGMAKFPLVPLALLLLAVESGSRRSRWLAPALTIAAATAWQIASATLIQVPLHRPDAIIDSGAQFHYLFAHPLAAVTIAAHTIRRSGAEYVAETIGNLGWLDTPLPKVYYGVATFILTFAAALGASARFAGWKSRPVFALAVLAVSCVAIFAALYVGYTPVGRGFVDGVQGRYFLPLLAMLPVAFVGAGCRWQDALAERPKLVQAIHIAIAVFPLVTLLVMYPTLEARYY